MFGKRDENGFWITKSKRYRFMFRDHDSLYIAFWRFRFRLMKPIMNKINIIKKAKIVMI